MTIRCTKCGQEKEQELFPPSKYKVNGKASWCRLCTDTNSQATGAVTRRRRKELWIQYKGGACANCGVAGLHIAAYDFHHRDPSTKLFGLGKNFLPFHKVKAELDKCDLLCSNCHRTIHANY